MADLIGELIEQAEMRARWKVCDCGHRWAVHRAGGCGYGIPRGALVNGSITDTYHGCPCAKDPPALEDPLWLSTGD